MLVDTIGGRYQYKLHVDLVIVLANNGATQVVGSEVTLPTRELNRAIAGVLQAIAPPYPGAKQTLGGLVEAAVAVLTLGSLLVFGFNFWKARSQSSARCL